MMVQIIKRCMHTSCSVNSDQAFELSIMSSLEIYRRYEYVCGSEGTSVSSE